MAIIYKQDGGIGSTVFDVAFLRLWNEYIPKPLFAQEVIGPAILRHANASNRISVTALLDSALMRLTKCLQGDQKTTLRGIAFPEIQIQVGAQCHQHRCTQ